MKIIRLAFAFLIAYTATAQTASVSSPDASNFPIIRAEINLFDAAGNPVAGAAASDFRVTENGAQKPITMFNCPPSGGAIPISSTLVLDISRSMSFVGANGYSGLSIAQTAALAWIDNIDLTISECAVVSFDDFSYLNQDFTTDRTPLQNAVKNLSVKRGTNYASALFTPPNGGIPVASRGKHKRILILLTDGLDPRTTSNEAVIIAAAQAANVAVYCITVRLAMPTVLKNIASQTGGAWYENVDAPDEAARIYRSILLAAQGVKPCVIEWQTDPSCSILREAIIEWTPQNARDTVFYTAPANALKSLTTSPLYYRFGGIAPGTFKDTTISLKTGASPVAISRTAMSSPEWSIINGAAPPTINIPANDSHLVTIRYAAPDSSRSYAELIIESDGCITTPPAFAAGFPGANSRLKTIKVTHPNGGEQLLANADTVIKWTGVLPDDEVTLKYSIDKGRSWKVAANSATRLILPWRTPQTPSDSCLMIAEQYEQPSGLLKIQHDDAVADISFSPDGQRIYTLTRKGEARQFSTQNGQLLRQYSPKNIKSFAISPNELFLATINSTGQLQLWDPQNGSLVRTNGNTFFAGKPVFTANDSVLLAMFGGNTIFAATLTPSSYGISSLVNIASPVSSMQFTPDGSKFIGAGTTARFARVWNYPTATTAATLPHSVSVLSSSISPDATTAATIDQNGRAALWNVATSSERGELGIGYKRIEISGNGNYAGAGGVNKSSNGLFPATIWTLSDGQFYRNLYGHSDTVTAITFSRDGRFAATSSVDNYVIIWDLSQISGIAQADTSDNLWSIIAPNISASDIDMGRMQVGMSKDSVITAYIENTGSAPVSVAKISLTGLRANEFAILSGDAPFALPPYGKRAVEFRFSPAGVGKRVASVVIQTLADTITHSIIGEGIIVGLRAVQNIDFGKVFLGGKKDTLVQVILENTGTVDLVISEVKNDGPDAVQFSIIDSTAGFLLPALETRPMKLRFAPSRLGRSTGSIVFEYAEPGSPEISLLAGEGICEDGGPATVLTSAPVAQAEPGDTLTIPLLLQYPAGKLTSNDRQFSASISFNGSVLTPLADSLRSTIPLVKQVINISGKQQSSDTLASLRFIATLGSSDTTSLEVAGFLWDLCSASPLVINSPITVKVCSSGGKRLYYPSQTAAAIAIYPNPATDDNSIIEFSTPENGYISVSIVDLNGRTVASVFDGFARQGIRQAALPFDKLIAGVYYVMLQTPTQRIVKRLITSR